VQERCNAAKASVQLLGVSQSTSATGGVIAELAGKIQLLEQLPQNPDVDYTLNLYQSEI
jgi:hypothetical protein